MLNENNIQAPFQYKIGENNFELLTRNGELELNTNNVQVKVFSGQRLFCADIGYAVDGALEEMEFLIDDIKVYPILLDELKDLQSVDVKENEVYLIKNDINFKSIIFFPPADLNKNFKYTITTYSSTFSAFMFDEIAKKLNIIDINTPIKNYYEDTDYKINDIIKYNGYLYRVFKDFTSDDTDYYLINNCNLITPFKKLELTQYKINDLVEYNNNFFVAQKDFTYESIVNLNDLLKPVQEIIEWNEKIKKVYKNQIILKDDFCYLVLITSDNYTFDELLQFKRVEYLNKASNTFYDDNNSGFGNNTNTVQKAIEKLNTLKQNNLKAGNNIKLDENIIDVNGGVSKDYLIGNEYFINDLIIYENRLYIANENFISLDWNTDSSKLTLLTASGSLSTASQVAFDNSKTNLEYISGYDFPKFKTPIPDTLNLILTDITNTTEYTAAITKQYDGSYILSANIENYNLNSSGSKMVFLLKSIDTNSNIYQMYSTISQFFEFSSGSNYIIYNLEKEECNISGIDTNMKFIISILGNMAVIAFTKQDKKEFNQGNYNITLNIKNKILQSQDANLFLINNTTASLYNLKFINNNGDIKLSGNIQNISTPALIGFYSPIIENYFNTLSADGKKVTSEIISNTGKTVKFSISKNDIENLSNESPLYILSLEYEDGTDIQENDIFTFNLSPDKNSKAEQTYSEVNNVQQLGEALTERLDKLDIIADGEEHPTGTYYQKTKYL